MAKNLKKLYKLEDQPQQIQKLKTHKVPSRIMNKQKDYDKIAKNTTRNALVKNESE